MNDKKYINLSALKLASVYLVLSFLWILTSDWLLFRFWDNSVAEVYISMFKGFLFIILSAVLVFLILRKNNLISYKLINESKQKEQYFKSIFDDNGSVSLIIDRKTGNIVDANNSALAFYGYSREQILNKNITEINTLSGEDLQAAMLEARTYKTNYFHFKHRTSKGNIKDVEVYSVPLVYKNMECLYSIIHDITDKINIENSLKKSENRMNYLLNNIDAVFYILNEKRRLVYISQKIQDLLGQSYTNDSKFKDLISKHVYHEDLNYVLSEIDNIFNSKHNKTIQFRIIDKNGFPFWVLNKISYIVFNNEAYLYGILIDINERELMHQDLIRTRDELEEANRVRTVVISNISHELRTPLNAILGFSSVLLMDAVGDDDIYESALYISNSAKRLHRTLDGLIKLNEIESGMRNIQNLTISAADFIKNVHNDLSIVYNKENIEFSVDDSVDYEISTDLSVLNDIVYTFIDNAFKFTNEGKIRIGSFRDDNECGFFVEDTGIGISPEKQEIIFEPFRQESEGNTRNFDGVGIGLTIAKKLAGMINSEIKLQSRQNVGSTFFVVFKND